MWWSNSFRCRLSNNEDVYALLDDVQRNEGKCVVYIRSEDGDSITWGESVNGFDVGGGVYGGRARIGCKRHIKLVVGYVLAEMLACCSRQWVLFE